ncbi:hypothetical protein Ancab_040233 [Ancistrocladus abbreviatus]
MGDNMTQYTALVAKQYEEKGVLKNHTKKDGKCEHCEGNHMSDKCWEAFGYPDWHPGSKERPQKAGVKYEPRKRGKKRWAKANMAQNDHGAVDAGNSGVLLPQLSPAQQQLMTSVLALLDKSQSSPPVAHANLAGPCKDQDIGDW